MHLWVWVNSCQTTFAETDLATYKKCPGRTTWRQTSHQTLKFDYELFNVNNFNIRYWSWNYRGCWHQTCPPIDPRPLSGIEPLFPVTRHHHGRPLSYHRKLIGQIFE
ncbi:uncharacterized protein MELLADRAFT_94733 [Melampsora larici-populina 98AG31]|uniref:Uncharacterized protein n=1 Tax=Melampsora larici-populina (strain 98AG31 / pathotype 3-4-7) TaxID=747676 RepID=F4S7R4_MELLP|nr:uncharacterized protein MELLADRAFT_94733 [Melampsora larici-populina 98AG31]EGF99318.1 hypothetical protein MELLADRAFT_94733 [Melampsora larici-populina 98AG31]